MNTFNYLPKQAGWVSDVISVLKAGKDIGVGTYMVGAGLTGGLGLALGHAAARIGQPTSIKENSDKILLSEALATEIDVTERKLADLERRRASLNKRKLGEQAYDRFV